LSSDNAMNLDNRTKYGCSFQFIDLLMEEFICVGVKNQSTALIEN